MREREVFIASSFSFQFWILLKLFWPTVGWFGKCSFKFCLDGFEALHWLHVVERFVTDLNNVLHGWYGITWRVRNRDSTLTLCLSLSLSGRHVVLLFFFLGGGNFRVWSYSIDLARGWEHIVLDTTFDESVSLQLSLGWTGSNTPKLFVYGILRNFYGNDYKVWFYKQPTIEHN